MRFRLATSLLVAAAPIASAQNYLLETLEMPGMSADDLIGSACDVSGQTIIVGGYGHDAAGILGTGGAWLVERQSGGAFGQITSLLPSDNVLGARFGYAVAIDGDVAMVGAYRDDTLFNDHGSVYVYERQPDGSWVEIQKLLASDIESGLEFGHSVAIDGDFAVIGSPGAKLGTSRTGAGYVFQRQGDGTWLEVFKCTVDDSLGNDEMGHDASISGTRIVLGAHLQDDNGNSSGAAYVFERQGDGTWPNTGKLLASDGASIDYFGYSVSVSGDTIVSGAWLDDDFGSGSGSAYVYELQPDGSWLEAAKLLSPSEKSGAHFGQSVWVEGDYALIGAIHETVNFKIDAGAAHSFARNGGLWSDAGSFFYDNVKSDQNYGHCVAVDNGTVVIGSSDNDEFFTNGGLVDVQFSYGASDVAPPVLGGLGTPGCDGPQTIGLAAPAQIDTAAFGFTCDNVPANSTGFLLVGDVADLIGTDYLGINALLHVNVFASAAPLLLDFFGDADGVGFAPAPLPNDPALVGAVLHAQGIWVWTECSLPPFNVSSSNLVSFTISAP